MRKAYIIMVLMLFFAGYIFSVQKMEHIIADGKTVLLSLAPVDPRALLMGDYMDLNYVVNGDIYKALRMAEKAREPSEPDTAPPAGQADAAAPAAPPNEQADAATRPQSAATPDMPDQGLAVLRISNALVPLAADFVRLYDGGPLQADEFLLAYKLRNRRVISVASAFYFEEGSAKGYEEARFGQFKVANDGKTLLMNLCDSQGQPIHYEKAAKNDAQP